jgi:arginyl-tRNA synthetase
MKRARAEAVHLLSRAAGLPEAAVAQALTDAAAERGEFAFPCFTLAKERRQAPPKIAAEIAAAFQPGADVAEARAEGPYVNLRVNRAALAARTLAAVAADGGSYGARRDPAAGTVVLDYSSPNVAKPLAFHHLRSAMIGNSLVRLYRAGGWKTVGINYLGDWGTSFGKLLLAWELHGAEVDLAHLDVEGLNALYVRVNAAIAEEKKAGGHDLDDRTRAWFKRLEDGDAEARRLWRVFVDLSLAEFQTVYDLLGISFDHFWGESAYEKRMPALIAELRAKGLLVESEGAQVVKLDDEGLPPCMIMKGDGASLYATRDLAAAIHRHEATAFQRALYVIDRGQAMHVQQFRSVLKRMGRTWAEGIVHVAFGVVRMGGKKAATRKGSMVLLVDVLDAAIVKVRELIQAKNPDLANAEAVAKDVGVGAVVFNDLKNFRENDIDFDLDAITSFEGNTGPYVMYSHARACSILRRAAAEPTGTGQTHVVAERSGVAGVPGDDANHMGLTRSVHAALLTHDLEHALVRLVARFPDRVEAARAADDPSQVAKHLLDLSDAFHAYHSAGGRDRSLRVLTEDPALRRARLALTNAVRQTMSNGLALLGIAAPTEM